MARRDLLPGVAADSCPPPVVFDSARAIRRARIRAAIYDTAQLSMLAGVDWLFLRWPLSHVPLVSRDHSVLVLAVLNAGLLTHIIVSRVMPRWAARRIATTWCLAERARFFAQLRRDQAR